MIETRGNDTLVRARCLSCERLIADPQMVNQAKLDAGMSRDQVVSEYGCPRCGVAFKVAWEPGWVSVGAIKATRTATLCDTACATATSVICKCECGGTNHGTR